MNESDRTDEEWMKHALELARKGQGKVAPNPMVGAVLVRNGKRVGEGFHAAHGAPHAETVALREAGTKAEGTTLYVTLEPCTFSGKTPPCVDAIIDAGVGRVVAAMPDPHPEVRGTGFEALRSEGIDVTVGVRREEATYLNRRFVTFHVENRPFLIAKWAMSLDGKIATRSGDSQWISSRQSRRRARTLRTDAGAVMVGIGTVIEDNPTLLAPDDQDEHPIRIIVDSRLRLTTDYNIVRTADKTRTIIATTRNASDKKVQQLEEAGLEIIRCEESGSQVDFRSLCDELAGRGIQAVLVEGGGTLLGSAFERKLVDDVKVFVAPKIIGGSEAVTPVEGHGIQEVTDALDLFNVRIERIDSDVLIEASFREPSDFEF